MHDYAYILIKMLCIEVPK